jgi:hypothetical protein
MEYYSVLKRNELLSHEKSWRKLNTYQLSEKKNLNGYAAWFQLYGIIETREKKISDCQRLEQMGRA